VQKHLARLETKSIIFPPEEKKISSRPSPSRPEKIGGGMKFGSGILV
jgi:hypothetical protein